MRQPRQHQQCQGQQRAQHLTGYKLLGCQRKLQTPAAQLLLESSSHRRRHQRRHPERGRVSQPAQQRPVAGRIILILILLLLRNLGRSTRPRQHEEPYAQHQGPDSHERQRR